jgi:hypothetical protein
MAFANSAEGQANGTVPTTGNTGGASGTAISSAPAIDGAGTITFSTDRAAYGTKSYKYVYIASGAAAHRMLWANGSAVAGRYAVAAAVYVPAAGDAIEDIMSIRHSGGNTCTLCLALDGRVQIFDAAGAAIAASKSTNPVSAPGWYYFCLTRTKGTGTGDGQLGYAYYTMDGTLIQSYNGTTHNAGTADSTHGSFGRSTGRTNAHTYYFDAIKGDALASGYFTPDVADLAATVYNSRGVIVASGGTPPYTITQTAGTTTAATVIDSGATSGQGVFMVAQHATDNLVYSVLDDNAVTVTSLTVTPLPSAAAEWPKKPSGSAPGSTWA